MDDKIKAALEKLGADPDVLVTEVEDEALIEALQERGFRVDKPVPVEKRVKLAPLKTKRFRLGVVSDTHLSSKFQQLTHLHDVFRVFEEEAVDAVLHAGDLVHGHHRMHRGMIAEMFVHGADAQVAYAVDKVPKCPSPGYIISGNHDLSWFKDSQVDVVRAFTEKRDDWTYMGAEGAYFEIGGVNLYLWHGGNTSYARSWNSQKWAEAVSPESKPHIMMDGHLHFLNYTHHRNIDCFQLPCFQGQTPFERRKRLFPDVGGLLLDIWTSKHGLEDLQMRWLLRRRIVENDY